MDVCIVLTDLSLRAGVGAGGGQGRVGVQGAEADHETALPTGEATPLHTTPHHSTPHHTTPLHTTPLHTTPHHSTPHHTTPHHSTPHHTTPHHSTPHHTTPHLTTPLHIPPHHILRQCLVGCQGNYEAMVARYRQLLTYIKGAVTRNYSEKSINSILDYISTSSNVSARPPPLPHPLCHTPSPPTVQAPGGAVQHHPGDTAGDTQ